VESMAQELKPIAVTAWQSTPLTPGALYNRSLREAAAASGERRFSANSCRMRMTCRMSALGQKQNLSHT